MKRLQDLEPAEVSLVPRGANKRKFLIMKEDDSVEKEDWEESQHPRAEDGKFGPGGAGEKKPSSQRPKPGQSKAFQDRKANQARARREREVSFNRHSRLTRAGQARAASERKGHENILSLSRARTRAIRSGTYKSDDIEKADDQNQRQLDERTETALKAVVRILTPLKGTVSLDDLKQVLDAADIQTESADSADQEGDEMGKTPVKKEHHDEAMKIAKKAYAETIHKLGKEKYSDEEDEDQDEEEVAKAKCDQEEEMTGDKKSEVAKGDFSDIPKEMRPRLEAIFKAQAELVKKNDELSAELSAVKRTSRRKEFVAKAESYKHLGVPSEDLADTLMALADANPKQYETVEKILGAANTQVEKGKLFAELGSSQTGGGGGHTWESIEKAAMAVVEKSGEKVSKEQAVDRFISTPDGKRMYADYISEHASSKRS